MREKFSQAKQAIKVGDKKEARRLLVEIVKSNPRNVQAWYGLSFVVDKREQQIDCLQRVLKYEPHHNNAQRLLQKLALVDSPKQQAAATQFDGKNGRTTSIIETNSKQHAGQYLPNDNNNEALALAEVSLTPQRVQRQRHKVYDFPVKHSRCLWRLDDWSHYELYERPDSLRFLFEDIAQLPIITNPHQELWLGVHLQAAAQLDRLIQNWDSHSDTVPFAHFLCQALLAEWEMLQQKCTMQELTPPKLELWVAELLTAQKNVYSLHRSRLRRFMRKVHAVNEEDTANMLLALVHQIVETLVILPEAALNQFISFVNIHQHLPSTSEMASWLTTDLDLLKAQTQEQVKQTEKTLAAGYLRYALRVAQGYIGQGVAYEDLVQAGFMGLLRAAKKFNYRVQIRFGAYATSWIWQAIGREIADQGRTIRLPVHVQESLRKWENACERFDDGCSSPVKNLEILFGAGLVEKGDYDALKRLEHIGIDPSATVAARYEKAVAKARNLREYSMEVFSLAEIDFAFTTGEAVDRIESVDELIPEARTSLANITDTASVREFIEKRFFVLLTDRERKVLALRCGWDDGEERTLEEVGKHFGLTRERIRQIEAQVYAKLRRRFAHNFLPDILELLPVERTPQYWQHGVHLIFPTHETRLLEDSDERHKLNSLLSQLPRSDWVQGRSGVQEGQRKEQLVAAFKELTTPAHVSDIAEQLNDSLEGKELDDSYVYALLLRDEDTFILLGQSIFSLVQWEKARAKEAHPILPCCPVPLPDPPGYEDAFFETVLVGQQALEKGLTAVQFIRYMLDWAGADTEQQNWFVQAILSSYYLMDLIPYVFYFGGDNSILHCTLPATNIQELRFHCLKTLTERLMAMPEFWWLFQQHQPARPTDLGEHFADIHPYGLDDVLQRLRLLTSLGAAQKLRYGEYRLTPLGEECANRWKREAVVETAVDAEVNDAAFEDDFTSLITW